MASKRKKMKEPEVKTRRRIKQFLVVEDPNTEQDDGITGLEVMGRFDNRAAAVDFIRKQAADAVRSWGATEGFKLGTDEEFSSHWQIYEFVVELRPVVTITSSVKYRITNQLRPPEV